MAHMMNLLNPPCRARNHFDCEHGARPPYDLRRYVTTAIVDTASYLDGWTMVAMLGDDSEAIDVVIAMLEASGVASDFDRGVRDATCEAFS